MTRVTVNGQVVEVNHGASIVVKDGGVYVDGVRQRVGELEGLVKVVVEGPVINLHVAKGDVEVNGGVHGDIQAGGSVRVARGVRGDVDAGGSVQCGDVGGSVDSGGSVQCGKVAGDAAARGSILHV